MILDHPSRLIRSAAALLIVLTMGLICTSTAAQDKEKLPPLLTDDDIELIKVYEVDLKSDPPPRIDIPKDELKKFLEENQQDDRIPRDRKWRDSFLKGDGYKKLQFLFDFKARDYYKHVRVKSQIQSLRDWRTIHRRYIHGFFQPTFATGQVPELYLFPRVRGLDAEKIEMTNFYILTQVTIGGKAIIDRNQPEESLLVQWGLPRDAAKFPAPKVDGWAPKFKGVKDERFIEHVDWIKSLIAANQDSTLGIEYKVPRHKKPDN